MGLSVFAEVVDFSAVVTRLGVNQPNQIVFDLQPNINGFTIQTTGAQTTIIAGKRMNLLAGYGYHLKHQRGVHWSWNESRMSPLHSVVEGSLTVAEPWTWRYAYNPCFYGYTAAFWGESEWTAELDRMALHGMSHIAVQAGTELIWQKVLTELGYPAERISAFISHPATNPWWLMGNLEGLSGPLTQTQIEREAKLGRFIVDRVRHYGMTPVAQGFVGLVPHDLATYCKQFDDLHLINQGNWVDGFKRPAILNPTTEAFQTIADMWYKAVGEVYGCMPTVFTGDLFHEGGNAGGINVTNAARSVETAMQRNSPQSIWYLMHWQGNPTEALLNGLTNEYVMVASLVRDMARGNEGKAMRSFYGKPWLWGELACFGGKQSLYGGIDVFAGLGKVQEAREANKMAGLAILSENGEINPAPYDLFFDRFWMTRDKNMTEAEVTDWFSAYILRRYGKTSQALRDAYVLLHKSVFSPKKMQEGSTETIICGRPSWTITKSSTWASGDLYYNPSDVLAAFEFMMLAAGEMPELLDEETFCYDLVDVGRQVLSDYTRVLLPEVRKAFDVRNLTEYDAGVSRFMNAIATNDKLTGTHRMWRFGRMYEQALAKGSTIEEDKNEVLALKRMVTTWSGRMGALNDYSHRQVSGLFADYYAKRWKIFFDQNRLVLTNEKTLEQAQAAVTKQCVDFEIAWATQSDAYTAAPESETLTEAQALQTTFSKDADRLYRDYVKTQGMPWSLDGQTELSFNVTDYIQKVGTYKASFLYKSGASALKIKSVSLYEGDTLIDIDTHAGWAGVEHEDNIYTLYLPKLRTNLDAYLIKAIVEGASSTTDSSGAMTLEYNELSNINMADATGKATSRSLEWTDGIPTNAGADAQIVRIADALEFNSPMTAKTLFLSGYTATTLTKTNNTVLPVAIWDFSNMRKATSVAFPIDGDVLSTEDLTLSEITVDTTLNIAATHRVTANSFPTVPYTACLGGGTLVVGGDLNAGIYPDTIITNTDLTLDILESKTVTIDMTPTFDPPIVNSDGTSVSNATNWWINNKFSGNGTLHIYPKRNNHLKKASAFTGKIILDGSKNQVALDNRHISHLVFEDSEMLNKDATLILQGGVHITMYGDANMMVEIPSKLNVSGENNATHAWGNPGVMLLLSGALTGDADAELYHINGGTLKFTGDVSGYNGTLGIGALHSDTAPSWGQNTTLLFSPTTSQTYKGAIVLGDKTHRVLHFDIEENFTVEGQISGMAKALIKDGNGTLTLAGAKTFTGGIALNAGKLSMDITQENQITLNANTTLALTPNADTTIQTKPSFALTGDATLDLSAMSETTTINHITGTGVLTIDCKDRTDIHIGDTVLTWATLDETVTFKSINTHCLLEKQGNALIAVPPTGQLFTYSTHGYLTHAGGTTTDTTSTGILSVGTQDFVYAVDFTQGKNTAPWSGTSGGLLSNLASEEIPLVNHQKARWCALAYGNANEHAFSMRAREASDEIATGGVQIDTNHAHREIVVRKGDTFSYRLHDKVTGRVVIQRDVVIGVAASVDALTIGCFVTQSNDTHVTYPAIDGNIWQNKNGAIHNAVLYLGTQADAGLNKVQDTSVDLENSPPVSLVWAGDSLTGHGIWNALPTNTPWKKTLASTTTLPYTAVEAIIFGEIAGKNPIVTVADTVTPHKITFANRTSAYTFTGSGTIDSGVRGAIFPANTTLGNSLIVTKATLETSLNVNIDAMTGCPTITNMTLSSEPLTVFIQGDCATIAGNTTERYLLAWATKPNIPSITVDTTNVTGGTLPVSRIEVRNNGIYIVAPPTINYLTDEPILDVQAYINSIATGNDAISISTTNANILYVFELTEIPASGLVLDFALNALVLENTDDKNSVKGILTASLRTTNVEKEVVTGLKMNASVIDRAVVYESNIEDGLWKVIPFPLDASVTLENEGKTIKITNMLLNSGMIYKVSITK